MTAYGERREAARKLREIADEDEWIVVKLAAALGIDLMRCESREEGEAEVVRRIADLVDPEVVAMKDELLPCPFCGGEAELTEVMAGTTEGWCPTARHRTWCPMDGVGVGGDSCWPEREDAIAAWNRRAG